ncbi:UNVERIFIED_CONTAM: Pleiotropic drug resistance protein 1 [Sesamum radiatum]|uniref:Pleiotropic drug resistance protein 1 n=1 Tax=Sesamum radiatum TaxID=300843 RepID=A0AAW2WK01_SESRA
MAKMDMNDVYRASNGFMRNASAAFRNDVMEIFSSSSRVHEDDDEALKWAALEKLPTFDRLRKGLLLGSRGAVNEVDIQDLGFQERKQLVERLVKVVEEDNEKFLLKFKNRIDRVGIQLPTIEVRFEHLNVETEVHVGNRALPSFKNFFINILEGFATYLHIIPSRKKHLSILHDVSGILKPGRMTLLLGPPSSGKTTLLLALAGKLDPALKVSGTVTYNGHSMKEFVPERTAAYISQHDVHIGEMTVRETLAFSARCQGVGSSYEMLAELSRREKEANIKPDPDLDMYMKAAAMEGQETSVVTDYVMKILGLEICADTMVGDQMIRGISGGQRKRVTTGEMLVGPAKALFMDEISTGLDSSTTFQVVNSIRQFVHILNGTATIALLQPEPETFDLFDDIILISECQIVYQGPRENVLEFFQSMGFKCPERKGLADFLQEVTSKKDQRQYWAHHDQPYRYITVGELAEAFKSFEIGRKLNAELSNPFDKSKSHLAALSTAKYGVSKKELLKACATRELLLVKRNSFVYLFRIFRLSVMGVIAMTIFFRTRIHKDINGGSMLFGSLYYVVSTTFFSGVTDISMTIQKLPVFYKQRDFFFYPAWAYGLPSWIVKIPAQAVEVAGYVAVTYYVIGYDPSVGRLFKHYLLILVELQTASAIFRCIAAVGRNMITANTYGFFVLLIALSMSGFVLSRDDVKKWWLWGYWTSPLMYAENALIVNEFTGHSWRHVLSKDNVSLAVEIVKSRGYFPGAYWYWIGLGALFGMLLLYNAGFILALTYLNPLGKPQPVLLEDERDETDVLTTVSGRDDENKNRGIILPFEQHWITFDEIKYSVDMPQEMKDRGATEDRLLLLKGVSGAFRPGVLTALMGVSGAGKTTLMDVLAGRKTGGYIEGSIRISGYPKKQETFARISGYCEQNDIHSPYVTVYESLLFSAWLRLPPDVDPETRKWSISRAAKEANYCCRARANPSIIFMDEPTSGLDARAAAIVMRTVRNTVDTGRTVVCTIHQPSIDIFEAFDELLLMKRGGQEIYVGPLGPGSCHLIQYFEGIEGVKKIKDGYNPATWMLEVTSSGQETMLGIDFADLYKNSELYRRNKALINELSTPQPGTKDLHFQTEYSQPFLTQCIACLWKQHWSYWRNPLYSAVRILYTAFLALMFGSMFWDLGSKKDTQQDLINAMGSMYASVFFLGVQLASSVQPVVAVERTVFYRERAAGLYSALPYAFGQAVIEVPYCFAQASIYGTIVYAMIGFEWTAAKYFWIRHSRPRTPVWWRWYHWANPVAWTLYGLVASQYGDVSDQLDTKQSVQEFVRSYFGFRHDFVGVVAAVIVGFGVVFGFIFAFSIKAFNFQKR